MHPARGSLRLFLRFRDVVRWLHTRGQVVRHAGDPGGGLELYRGAVLLGLLLPLKRKADASCMY